MWIKMNRRSRERLDLSRDRIRFDWEFDWEGIV